MFANVQRRILGSFIKVPQSGERNTDFGVYASTCCDFEIVISVGAEFPPCPHHPASKAEWQPLQRENEDSIRGSRSREHSAA